MLKMQSEQEFYRTLGRRLRKMRAKTKLSPYYFGRLIGMHCLVYYEMEQGRIHPTPYQIYCIMHRCAPDMLQRFDAERDCHATDVVRNDSRSGNVVIASETKQSSK